jgi:hypothetical protein
MNSFDGWMDANNTGKNDTAVTPQSFVPTTATGEACSYYAQLHMQAELCAVTVTEAGISPAFWKMICYFEEFCYFTVINCIDAFIFPSKTQP